MLTRFDEEGFNALMSKNLAVSDYEDYAGFARAVYETGIISDPWFDGNERFGMRGIVLEAQLARALEQAAERTTYLHHELVQILLNDSALLDEFYHLTPYQQAMWESSGGMWHGQARADLFVCTDGRIVCCELNSDTPSGQPEAVILNRLLHSAHEQDGVTNEQFDDPNASFEERWVRMLRASHAKRTCAPLRRVGIIYPTELTEDLAMITLFTRWLERAGIKVVAGSPYNLRRRNGKLEVLGAAVDLVVRHYKTDWWGERVPVWSDAPDYPDAEPLHAPLGELLAAEMNNEVTIVNPFGSVVTQNKLSLAFFWEEHARFSKQAQGWIRKYIPETRKLTNVSLDKLRTERKSWVLKSDYGCEGQETICGAFVSEEIWEKALCEAVPERFVAQRFFHVAAEKDGRLANYGVYVMGGMAGGFFTRLARQSTEYTALTVPTYILKEK
ncbi:MAG: glutathionylspermidine synthase family protein [Pyrinomonadaceae bacterium]|nr:glutathionylspermidine synthase family protein [Pyrinomonadaceae bacterium]